jgi:hypothetical protein
LATRDEERPEQREARRRSQRIVQRAGGHVAQFGGRQHRGAGRARQPLGAARRGDDDESAKFTGRSTTCTGPVPADLDGRGFETFRRHADARAITPASKLPSISVFTVLVRPSRDVTMTSAAGITAPEISTTGADGVARRRRLCRRCGNLRACRRCRHESCRNQKEEEA